MGGCFSQQTGEEESGPSRTQRAQMVQSLQNLVVPEVTWETDTEWAKSIEESRAETAVDDSGPSHVNVEADLFKRAREWLNKKYPDCAMKGSIEDIGDFPYATTYGRCKYPTKSILVLDDSFTGVIYASALIVDVPHAEAGLEGPDMAGAKIAALKMLTTVQAANGTNVTHAFVHIFVGDDLVTCKFNAENQEPTVTKMDSEQSKEFKKSNKGIGKSAKKNPEQWRGLFRSAMFQASLGSLMREYPGCTVWDEGEFSFSVGDKVYPYPTRLLVARKYENMAEDVDATHFKVTIPGNEELGENNVLLRNSNLEKDPGGIVAAWLVLAVAEDDLWPQAGAHFSTPQMKAATQALLALLKKWNKDGKTQRCLMQICMGADMLRYKLVGEKFELTQETTTPGEKKFDDLEKAFNVKLVQQAKHELWESESQFQAIKRQINERAAANPERYAAMLPMIALQSATHFLEMNFPGCEVSDLGEFPATVDNDTILLGDTRLVIAKTPNTEKHNVVAVNYLIPSPKGNGWEGVASGQWLDTKEMKIAEAMFLNLLKKWYVEEKTAEDCFVQVVMGTDASIYLFVDGDKFVDPSEERMAQLKWG